MAIKVLFNPIIAFLLFMTGMWLGIIFNPYFGLLTISGGLLLGFSPLRNEFSGMNKKTKVLFCGTLIFFLTLFSTAYLVLTTLLF